MIRADVQEIVKIRVSHRAVEDFLAWNMEKDGRFTVRIAYHLAVTERTLTDRDGETDPAWDHTVWFAVSPTAAAAGRAYLHVLLRTERYFGGSFGLNDRDVGEVFIPVAGGGTPWRCASYPVRKAQSSRHRGTLSLGPVVVPPSEPDCQAVMPPCRPARRNFNWNGRFELGLGSGLLGGGFAGTAAYRSG
ncbi:hypothetical protein VPH35_027137 [Triticum aestivum]